MQVHFENVTSTWLYGNVTSNGTFRIRYRMQPGPSEISLVSGEDLEVQSPSPFWKLSLYRVTGSEASIFCGVDATNGPGILRVESKAAAAVATPDPVNVSILWFIAFAVGLWLGWSFLQRINGR